MDPTSLKLLEATRIGLGRLAVTEDEFARRRLIALLNLAVGELNARTTHRPAALRRTCDAARGLALRGCALLAPDADGGRRLTKLESFSQTSGDLQAQEHAYAEIKGILVECVVALSEGKGAHKRDDGGPQAVDRFFEDVARHEVQAAIELDVRPPTSSPGNEEMLDTAALAAYFARPGRDRKPMTLIEAKSLSGGFSRQTVLVTLLDPENDRLSLVMRKQLPGGLLGASCLNLAGEIPYLELAHDAGLPVPKVLWYESDSRVLGGDFVVLSKMQGGSLGTSVAASGVVDEGIVRQLAGILAKLHTIDWSSKAAELCTASGLPAELTVSSTQAALAGCEAFERLWRESNLAPLPTLEIIADWLKRRVPPTSRLPMLSHGDIGFHNMMGEDGRLTGLLDWETARLADPAKDMAMTRNFITKHVPWDRFYGWYRDAGGPAIDADSLDYYAVYHSFAHLLVCEVALGARFLQSPTPDLEYLQLGVPVRVHFSEQMLKSCARIWNQPPR